MPLIHGHNGRILDQAEPTKCNMDLMQPEDEAKVILCDIFMM